MDNLVSSKRRKLYLRFLGRSFWKVLLIWRSCLSFPTLPLRVAALRSHTANQEGANQVFLPCKWSIWLLAGNHAGEYTPKKKVPIKWRYTLYLRRCELGFPLPEVLHTTYSGECIGEYLHFWVAPVTWLSFLITRTCIRIRLLVIMVFKKSLYVSLEEISHCEKSSWVILATLMISLLELNMVGGVGIDISYCENARKETRGNNTPVGWCFVLVVCRFQTCLQVMIRYIGDS